MLPAFAERAYLHAETCSRRPRGFNEPGGPLPIPASSRASRVEVTTRAPCGGHQGPAYAANDAAAIKNATEPPSADRPRQHRHSPTTPTSSRGAETSSDTSL